MLVAKAAGVVQGLGCMASCLEVLTWAEDLRAFFAGEVCAAFVWSVFVAQILGSQPETFM